MTKNSARCIPTLAYIQRARSSNMMAKSLLQQNSPSRFESNPEKYLENISPFSNKFLPAAAGLFMAPPPTAEVG